MQGRFASVVQTGRGGLTGLLRDALRGESHPRQSPFLRKGEEKRVVQTGRGGLTGLLRDVLRGESHPLRSPFLRNGKESRVVERGIPLRRAVCAFADSASFMQTGAAGSPRPLAIASTPFGTKGVGALRRGDAGTTHLKNAAAHGFTLIELMVTLAVLAILSMVAVPSFRHIIVSTNLSGINNDLAGDLQFARTEAVSRQVDVAVAASTGGWQDGWSVQIPAAASAGTPTVLRVHAAVPAQYVVNGGAATGVTYQPQGTVLSPVDAVNGTCFTIAAADGQNNAPHYLQVLPAGMVQQVSGSTTPAGCPSPPATP